MTTLSPLSKDRLTSYLAGVGLKYQVDDDGEIGVGFNSATFWLANKEEGIFSVRGHWHGLPTPVDVELLQQLVSACNSERNGPVAFLINQDDEVRLLTQVSTYMKQGWSDEQLDHFFDTTMRMSFSFFNEVEEALPHLVTWQDEED